jgi:small-conductance mechanosensitive channel
MKLVKCLKTTRIKNLKGGEMVITNKELSTARVRNLSRVGRRKVFMEIKIEKKDDREIVETAPETLKKIISSVPKTKYYAAYLKEVSEKYYIYFLQFEVNKMPYREFLTLENAVNVKILEGFADREVELKLV